MNLAALKRLIDYLESNGITSCEEKLISIVLAFFDKETIQQCEIIESLGLAKHHCINVLEALKNKKVIIRLGKRDIFYRFANRLIFLQPTASAPTTLPESPSPLNLSLVNLTELNLTNRNLKFLFFRKRGENVHCW